MPVAMIITAPGINCDLELAEAFALAGAGGVLFIFQNYGRDLPEYQQLADYEPPVMTRVYAGDGRLLAEYAVEKRVFVPIKAMPRRVVQAFLAAEDKNFYIHPGVDVLSVLRAAFINVKNIGTSKRPVGASTITQQVAKNFLLTNELSWRRKIQEAILAFRIERAFEKSRILELYLNEIYLGFSSYGIALAALNYFNKSMDELTIAEAAFLAALPKAPNNYNPVTKPAAARARRGAPRPFAPSAAARCASSRSRGRAWPSRAPPRSRAASGAPGARPRRPPAPPRRRRYQPRPRGRPARHLRIREQAAVEHGAHRRCVHAHADEHHLLRGAAR